MYIGQLVFFKDNGILKRGFVSKIIGNENLLIICEDVSYIKKYWEVRKVQKNEEKEER